MKPDVLETPPKTLAESPYAANDGFAAVNAAAPCVQNGGFREIHLVRFLFAKAMIHPKERKLVDTRDKISFSLPKTLEAKEEHIREQTISISCCFSTNPLFSQNRNAYCFEDFVVARECASVGSIERSHRGRVCALSKRTRDASSSRALEEERRVLQPN